MTEGSREVKLTRADEQKYQALYGWGWRQLRRWIDVGEKAGDPIPLDDPTKMPAWVSRHSKWRVPEQIERAAVAAARGETPAAAAAATPPVPSTDAANSRAPSGGTNPPVPGKPINLEDYDPEEGDRLRELKQIQAAKFAALKEKLAAGTSTSLDETKYLDLCETIDKIETRVTERLKKRGLYILRDAVERDLAANAEFLRQSHDSMVRKVMEWCPSLTAEQRLEVAAGITRARSAEQRILARLSTFQNGDDLLRELNAA
jgi:hypothetical protein